MIKASKETMKSINKENVLNSFINRDVLSKSDVSARTKLCSATVSNLISELVKEGFVQQESLGTSSGGRKPMLYALNGDLAYVLSIRVTPKGATAAIINLKCKIVQSKIIPQPVYGEWGLNKLLTHVVHEFHESYPELFQKITAVAISLPGIMQFSTKTVIYSAPLGLENIAVGEIIDQVFPFPIKTHIFKDTDALLLGEYHFSSIPEYKNVAYILCESGVGFSIILQELLFSRDGCGLELGHQTIDINAKPCKCSMPGCIGTLLSETPAVKRYFKLYQKQEENFISLNSLNYDDLVNFYLDGDLIAKQVLQEQINYLAIATVNIVNLFNPDAVIIGGSLARLDITAPEVLKYVKAHALKPFVENIDIIPSTLGMGSSLLGMAYQVLQIEVFKSARF